MTTHDWGLPCNKLWLLSSGVADGLRFRKQARQYTGSCFFGINGTVDRTPHSAQLTTKSVRYGRSFFFALHFLQLFGRYLKPLARKKSCSPAENTKSSPQAMQVISMSTSSFMMRPVSMQWGKVWNQSELVGVQRQLLGNHLSEVFAVS